ncbi:NAD(P)H-binding protein [Granulosicoccus sp. 3-233]|uniref:NAD(P)H-binding protein n=1 Tax=Granulosicoccus sp. 3-233 TaxID=3417969 RepID=UPI003D32DDD6
MLGATGAVGTEVVQSLRGDARLTKLALLGRRELSGVAQSTITQHRIDVLNPDSYASLLSGYQCAICTLGVGEPSSVSREEFLRIDKQAVIDFATACRQSGVEHFQLLSSVGADARSRSFYLRSKGELNESLEALNFRRLSLFQPSMIITPVNRYGISQALTLALWPGLSRILFGPLQKFRGIDVSTLGKAMALNSWSEGRGVERLHWDEMMSLYTTGQHE